MKVYILEGPKSSGKTTTLEMLYAVLFTNNAEVKCPLSLVGDKDFEVVFAYRNKKVAIFSQGDYTKNCKETIAKYADSIDVLIMAHSSNLSELKVPTPHTSQVFQKRVKDDSLSIIEANAKDCKDLENAI